MLRFNRGRLHVMIVRLCLLTSMVLSGCVTKSPVTSYAQLAKQGNLQWYAVRFKLNWPEHEELDFSPHLLIADRIVAPLVAKHGAELPLWRVHRRAARDIAGHRFSFLFYSDQTTVNKIFAEVKQDKTVTALLQHGVLQQLQLRENDYKREGPEGSSDPNWPIEIQKSWPFFIMGVSQAWIDLIAQESLVKTVATTTENHIPILLSHYQDISERVTKKWSLRGRHAYLHHLNAVFGYEPVYIGETKSWQNF